METGVEGAIEDGFEGTIEDGFEATIETAFETGIRSLRGRSRSSDSESDPSPRSDASPPAVMATHASESGAITTQSFSLAVGYQPRISLSSTQRQHSSPSGTSS